MAQGPARQLSWTERTNTSLMGPLSSLSKSVRYTWFSHFPFTKKCKRWKIIIVRDKKNLLPRQSNGVTRPFFSLSRASIFIKPKKKKRKIIKKQKKNECEVLLVTVTTLTNTTENAVVNGKKCYESALKKLSKYPRVRL